MHTVVTDRDEFERLARDAPPGARVPIEVRLDVTDPFAAYRRARYREGGFFTVPNDGREGWGYFGVRPSRRIEAGGDPDDEETDSFAELRDAVEGERLVRGDCEVPYPSAYVGWVSYDTLREKYDIEPRTVEHRKLPRLQFGLYDCLVSWKEPRGDSATLRVTCCPRVGERGDLPEDASLGDIYERGRERAEKLARRIEDGNPESEAPPAEAGVAAFESFTGKDDHRSQVEGIQEYIDRGETNRAEASHHLVGPAVAHPVEVFDALREINPAPLLSLVEFPGIDLVSANMQLLLGVEDGVARNRYYAGTHPRGETEEEDQKSLETIRSAGKYTDEHEPLAEVTRGDLEDCCDPDTVEVLAAGEVESFSEIHHLVGKSRGELRDDVSPVDAVRAVLPGPLAGDPDEAVAAQIIENVQQNRRGPYCGCIATFGMDGDAQAGTNVRTLTRYEDEYYLGVGGGITDDSVPEWEFAETINKGRALVNAIDEATDETTDVLIAEEFDQKPIERE